MEKLNQSAANLEVLINNTPLTAQQRNALMEDLKFLYESAKKSLDEVKLKEAKKS